MKKLTNISHDKIFRLNLTTLNLPKILKIYLQKNEIEEICNQQHKSKQR